jgi:hypothetical protein
LANYPDEFRSIEIDLASIGGEEGLKNNFKYADDAIKYGKQSLADIDANKAFTVGGKTRWGVSAYEYKAKEEAIGWLNLYVGLLMDSGKKDKLGALPYLYKSTQSPTDSSKQAASYSLIGGYYADELDKIIEQIQTKVKDQKETDTPEVAKQKVDEIKGLIAMSNGYAERAMDAYGRAVTYSKDDAYKTRTKAKIQAIYKVRTGKDTGSEAWVATAVTKPFVDPKTPVTPISDPEPTTTTTTGATATPPTTTPATTPVNNTTTKPVAKPDGTTPKPAGGAPAKPTTKRQASIKKSAVRKNA